MENIENMLNTVKHKSESFYVSLCPPARLFLVLMILFYCISTLMFLFIGKEISLIKDSIYLVSVGIWTIIHDSLCNYGWDKLSWVLVGLITITRPLVIMGIFLKKRKQKKR